MFNRVAFVTGASRGIGREIALTLCRAGFDIVVASPEIEKNEEVAEKIRACSGQALPLNLDLLSYDSIREGFAKALQQFGRIDVLVNNAGVTRDGLAVRMKREDWDRVLQINLYGAFFATQQVLPAMMKQRYGRIVNIASVVGESGNAGQANYVASKAGLIGLTKALAQEMAPREITVNAVAPGFIDTDMTAVLTDELKEKLLAQVPLRRLGRPEEIAAAVRFLASDEAGYITGHVLNVNGGMYM
ncbi:MAG TPA: 3-oxoacyl-[acyl-carrier-protein] reductase [Bryobacteraceae bacterium]|jgi:3-oxoacyl-[acyl-carrier protein] reductase|nr:3-oxoacyl-[acyl-carrier-protein] reductase [Bryobacteraceae bacterium]